VAITRAKRGLIVVGNPVTLASNPRWANWLEFVRNEDLEVQFGSRSNGSSRSYGNHAPSSSSGYGYQPSNGNYAGPTTNHLPPPLPTLAQMPLGSNSLLFPPPLSSLTQAPPGMAQSALGSGAISYPPGMYQQGFQYPTTPSFYQPSQSNSYSQPSYPSHSSSANGSGNTSRPSTNGYNPYPSSDHRSRSSGSPTRKDQRKRSRSRSRERERKR